MLIWTLAIYIIVLFIVWWFFIVARMHTLKFKNFSTHIVTITNSLMIFLIILSILGFIFIFYINSGNSTYELKVEKNIIEEKVEKNKSYENEIIWDDYY